MQLSQELRGQLSWLWGFHTNTVPPAYSLVKKASDFVCYLLSWSHLQ